MSPDIIAANLAAHWNATARTGRRQRGTAWYPTAREWAEGLACETGHTLAQVVAVLAITSPGAQLVTNVRWTESIMRGGYWESRPNDDRLTWVPVDTGGRFPNMNRPKIAGVLADPDAAEQYVTGPKVGPFHRAIMGDRDALVLDRWAIFAATGERGDGAKVARSKQREAVEGAYRALARRVGVTVRDLQAILWLQVRETTERAGGGPVRFADFTLGLS